MDIDLLSKMVKELILDNDKVALPGVGAFYAELMPAVFSEKGYAINPPYRRLSFRQKIDDDNLLINLYASSNNISIEDSERILREFLQDMKNVLCSRKVILFPGLGKMRATTENIMFFVSDENLDIYPEGVGLSPISLKTHDEYEEVVEESQEEIVVEASEEENVVEEPVEENVKDAENVDDTVEEQVEDMQDGNDEKFVEKLQENIVVEESQEENFEDEQVEDMQYVEEEEVVAELGENDEDVENVDDSVEKQSENQQGKFAHKDQDDEKKYKGILATLIIVAIILVLVGAFFAIAVFFPDFMDSILYSKEDLEVIRYFENF